MGGEAKIFANSACTDFRSAHAFKSAHLLTLNIHFVFSWWRIQNTYCYHLTRGMLGYTEQTAIHRRAIENRHNSFTNPSRETIATASVTSWHRRC